MFDHHRVQQDFFTLKSFLNQARYSALETNEKFMIRFHSKQATLHHFDGSLISTLTIPTLYQVNYQTTLGNDMIVSLCRMGRMGTTCADSWLGF
jgi:hypothetical protein